MEREQLIDLLEDAPKDYGGHRSVVVVADYLMANGVTVQKHGRWIIVKHSAHTNCYCSVCNEQFYYYNKGQLQIDKMPYCPNCGAKMDKEENE